MRLTTLISLLLVGCSGSDNQPDAGPADVYFADGATDAGFAPDADLGFPEPDRDNDGVPDEADNCPDQMNPQQENEDGDPFGDICDPCPYTPHPPGSAADWCAAIAEQEPNDVRRSGQTITLPEIGRALEVTGNIEAATGTQAVDRFRIPVTANSFIRVAVRRLPGSMLEPAVVASGGYYRTPREAGGNLSAQRDLFLPGPSAYEVKVLDRRGLYQSQPQGGENFGYALSIEVLAIPEDVLEVQLNGGTQRRRFEFTRPGEVKVYRYDGPRSNCEFGTETDYGQGLSATGVDAILVLTRGPSDQTNFYLENNNGFEGQPDAEIVDELGSRFSGATHRVVVDHRRVVGTEEAIGLRLTPFPESTKEIEPNNRPEEAQHLRNREIIIGYTGLPAPDEDWMSVALVGGQYLRIGAGPFIQPSIELYQEQNGSLVRKLRSLLDSSVYYAVAETGRYYIRLADRRNQEPPYQAFGQPYDIYAIASTLEYLSATFQTVTTSQNIRARFPQGEPKMFIFPVEERAVRIELTRTSSVPGVEPRMRLLGPDGKGLVAEDFTHIEAVLQPADFPYYLSVDESRQMGFSGELIDFSIDVVLTPQE